MTTTNNYMGAKNSFMNNIVAVYESVLQRWSQKVPVRFETEQFPNSQQRLVVSLSKGARLTKELKTKRSEGTGILKMK